ncbi:MAG: sulfotransferase family 2 domain-containing protein [Hyphomonas sp.]|nr:sulfotransferase family 2 domain-containing protein [Hyphomonas sp.]
MLYDPAHKFIFVHIWKTGGESIVAGLRDHCPPYFRNRYINKGIRLTPTPSRLLLGWRAELVLEQHMTGEEIRQIMPREAFDESFKFTFVRNPWDWQVSAYFYAIQTRAHSHHEEIRSLGSFDAFVRYQCERGAPSQSSFVFDQDGRSLMDFVGRFEYLEEDFQTVCQKLGIEAALPHRNASQRDQDWRSYYTDETRALVGDLFRRDIEEFGYSWD